MDIYSKLSQLVHMGEFENVKTILNNVHHPDKHHLYVQCLRSSVAAQRYDMADYFIQSVPSCADTAHFFKVAIRESDHQMVDILLKNKPSQTVCSEAVFEAIEYNDITTIQKMLSLSHFVSEPSNYMACAIRNGSSQSLIYLLQSQPPSDEVMEVLLLEALHSGYQDQNALQILDDTMSYSSINVLQKIAKKYENSSRIFQVQRLVEYCGIRVQHDAITAAIGQSEDGPRPTFRKI